MKRKRFHKFRLLQLYCADLGRRAREGLGIKVDGTLVEYLIRIGGLSLFNASQVPQLFTKLPAGPDRLFDVSV